MGHTLIVNDKKAIKPDPGLTNMIPSVNYSEGPCTCAGGTMIVNSNLHRPVSGHSVHGINDCKTKHNPKPIYSPIKKEHYEGENLANNSLPT